MSQNDIGSIYRPANYKYSIIIPAAGTGSRMKSYGAKSLIDVSHNRKILDLQIEIICSYMINPQIILVGGHEYNKVAAYIEARHKHICLIKNDRYESTNVGASIKIGLAHRRYNRVLVVNGDLVFNQKTLAVPIGRESLILTDANNTMKDEEVGCTVDKHYVEHMMYDLTNKWAQIAYFCGNELKLLDKICNSSKIDNDFGFEIINRVMNAGGLFKAVCNRESRILDIDSSKDLLKIKDII